MIDWHSHILPGIDDGSRDVEESLALLKMLSDQGVDTVIATPHFYANDESVDSFIKHRQNAYDALMSEMPGGLPRVLLGAEVRYYMGIGRLPVLGKLCIENSKILLLEMPMEKWSDYTVKELVDIANTKGVRLVLAHVERYLPLQKSRVFDKLIEANIMMQSNASFFAAPATKRKALSLLRKEGIHLIGSDCHNVSLRPPRIERAYETIRKKFGDEIIDQLNEFSRSLLT